MAYFNIKIPKLTILLLLVKTLSRPKVEKQKAKARKHAA